MATIDLSSYHKESLPDAGNMRIGIVVSEWNSEITSNLLQGCQQALADVGMTLDKIKIIHVPGSFELPFGAQMMLENHSLEAVICLGSVVRGETPHFDFVCQTCADGVKDVALKYNKPVIFGVLTDNNIEQARDRSGGRLGNKGVEAAITAVKMVATQRRLEKHW